jgi:hypothetical protein
VIAINGGSNLYTLDRTANNVDSAGLVVHTLDSSAAAPFGSTSASFDVTVRTAGLLDPDGILGVVPGSNPLTIIYLQKQLGADTTFPVAQQCTGKSANHDITTLRLAQTTDGVAFTDMGPLTGLNDSTDVTPNGTRWVAPRGTILALANGRYGMFFSGGSCLDNDSDAFHFVGYAESDDLLAWTVRNDMNGPILSIAPVTTSDDTGASVTIPATAALVATQGWYEGRVYGPSATIVNETTIVMSFAGYHRAKPKDAYGDYRTIGRFTLSSNVAILGGSGDRWQ